MIVHSDDRLRIAIVDDLCVLRWSDSPGVAQFDAVLRATKKPAALGRLALLNVADAPGKMPHLSSLELAAGKRMSIGLEHVTKAVAHVILMDGFGGVSVRMIISTLMMVRRSRSPNQVFDSLEAGAAWLSQHLADPRTATRIGEVYQSVEGGGAPGPR